ncbi:MAG: hypothetical protein AAF471_03195 [Myxococcota bacterium]
MERHARRRVVKKIPRQAQVNGLAEPARPCDEHHLFVARDRVLDQRALVYPATAVAHHFREVVDAAGQGPSGIDHSDVVLSHALVMAYSRRSFRADRRGDAMHRVSTFWGCGSGGNATSNSLVM